MGNFRVEFYCFAVMLTFLIFGDNDFAVRFPSALMGALSIPLLYFLTKELYNGDKKIAYLVATLLAVDGYHVYFSRVAWADVSSCFFLLLSSLCFLYGIKGERQIRSRLLLLAVIALSIAFFFKMTAIFMVPVWYFYLSNRYGKGFFSQHLLKPIVLLLFIIGSITIPFNLLVWLYKGSLGSEIKSFVLLRGPRMFNPFYIGGGLSTFFFFLNELSGQVSLIYFFIILAYFFVKIVRSRLNLRKFLFMMDFVDIWFLTFLLILCMIGPGPKYLGNKLFDIYFIITEGVGGYHPQIYVMLIPPMMLLCGSFLANLYREKQNTCVKVVILLITISLPLLGMSYILNYFLFKEPDFVFFRKYDTINHPAWYRDYGFRSLRNFLVKTYGSGQESYLLIVDDDIHTFQWWWYLRGFNFIFMDELVNTLLSNKPLHIYLKGKPYPPYVTDWPEISATYSKVVVILKSNNVPRTRIGPDDPKVDEFEREISSNAKYITTIEVADRKCFFVYEIPANIIYEEISCKKS